jgi:hypothetical protein
MPTASVPTPMPSAIAKFNWCPRSPSVVMAIRIAASGMFRDRKPAMEPAIKDGVNPATAYELATPATPARTATIKKMALERTSRLPSRSHLLTVQPVPDTTNPYTGLGSPTKNSWPRLPGCRRTEHSPPTDGATTVIRML